MKRRRRLQRVGKWGATGLSVIVLLLWLASARWMIEYQWSRGTSMYGVFICRGAAAIYADVEPDVYLSGEWAYQDRYHRPKLLRGIAADPWRIERLDPGLPQIHWPAVWAGCRSGSVSCLSGTDRLVPFWMPFIVILIPTAILWWRDRPPRSGHCECGYDLTGNVSGTCPECGRVATGDGDRARSDEA